MEITIEKLAETNPDAMLAKMERAGLFTVESKIKNTGYVIKEGHVVILRGKWGTMGIKTEKLGALIEELQEIKELAIFREKAHVKGA